VFNFYETAEEPCYGSC